MPSAAGGADSGNGAGGASAHVSVIAQLKMLTEREHQDAEVASKILFQIDMNASLRMEASQSVENWVKARPDKVRPEVAVARRSMVYLGFAWSATSPRYDYTNMEDWISTAEVGKRIKEQAATWAKGSNDYKFSPFRQFFEWNEAKGHYEGIDGANFHVDHILPKAWGGLDHPRNYCIMWDRLNLHFGPYVWEKLGYLDQAAARMAAQFNRDINSAPNVLDAKRRALATMKKYKL